MIVILFILAFLLRIIAVITPAIWYDEAFTLHVATLPMREMLNVKDFTPPLWEMLLHPFVVLNSSVITIRLIALECSILALFIAWLITRELNFNREQTLLMLFISATLPGLIWTGSDGRVYALLGCLYLLGIYAVLTDRRILLLCASIALIMLHATGVFFVVALYYYWFVEQDRDLPEALTTGAGLSVLCIIWYFSLITHTGDGLFMPMSITYFFSQWTMAYFIGTTQTLWFFGFVILGLTTGMFLVRQHMDVFAFMPLLLMVLASFSTVNLITYRTISPTLIPFALLLAYNYNGKLYQRLIALTWIALLTICSGTYNFTLKGSQQRQAAQIIQAQPARIVYATSTVAMPFDYYLHNIDHCLLQTSPDGALLGDYDFGFTRCTADDLHGDYWLIIPNDPKIPAEAYQQMTALAMQGTLITELHYPQISPVKVYRVDNIASAILPATPTFSAM